MPSYRAKTNVGISQRVAVEATPPSLGGGSQRLALPASTARGRLSPEAHEQLPPRQWPNQPIGLEPTTRAPLRPCPRWSLLFPPLGAACELRCAGGWSLAARPDGTGAAGVCRSNLGGGPACTRTVRCNMADAEGKGGCACAARPWCRPRSRGARV